MKTSATKRTSRPSTKPASRPSRNSRRERPPGSSASAKQGDLPVRNAGEGKIGRSWVFYGRAGTGKTTLTGTFPTPILLLDCKDDGDDSVSEVKDVKVMDIKSSEDLEQAYWWLKQNPGVYKTVAIDTITQFQQIKIEEIGGDKAAKAKKAVGDWGTMTKSDWGTVSSYMKTWITNFRDLDMDVVFLAQDRVFNVTEDEEVESHLDPEVGPRLSPATMSHLCAAVSIIGNTFVRTKVTTIKTRKGPKEKETAEYCLRLGPSASYITKIRKPKAISLPDFLTDPTYEDLLETIKGTN